MPAILTDSKTPRRGFSASTERTERREQIDMAPKGQKFELKTPKGTRDCMFDEDSILPEQWLLS